MLETLPSGCKWLSLHSATMDRRSVIEEGQDDSAANGRHFGAGP